MRTLSLSLLAALALSAGACANGVSAETCAKVADHLIDLQQREAAATATSSDELLAGADVARTLQERRPQIIDDCVKQASASMVECVLAADSAAALRSCRPLTAPAAADGRPPVSAARRASP